MTILHHTHRRGFTCIDAIALAAVAGVGVAALVPVASTTRNEARGPQDATQLRGIVQSMAIWANNNKDRFPTPSSIDIANDTVQEEGRAKDTSANVFSLMLYNEMFTPTMLISPKEPNEKIKAYKDYGYFEPTEAINPARALWDPKFSANFIGKEGNLSYAHLCLNIGRRNKWKNTFDSASPITSVRGPHQIGELENNTDRTVSPTFAENFMSSTYMFNIPHDSWSGDVAYADGHAEMLDARLHPNAKYRQNHDFPAMDQPGDADVPFSQMGKMRDWLFLDEAEDEKGSNNYLGIFIKAGPKRADFKAIWD